MRPKIGRDGGKIGSLSSIPKILDALNVGEPSVRERAIEIYSAAVDGSQGIGHRELRAAAVYASCRLLGIPKTLKEVAGASGVRTKSVARCYRRILTDWDIKVPIQDPATYIPEIAARVGLGAEAHMRALEILEVVKRNGLAVGKDPKGMAAAALFETYEEIHLTPPHGVKQSVTQKVVADAAGVDELTVRNRSRQIRSLLGSG